MPSARIKTLAVEDAHSLAEDLRTRGFVVEIVSPDKILSEPVDLEVTLEECEAEAALQRAEEAPDADDVCVFVAPGALTEGHRPMIVIPLFAEPITVDPVAKVIAMPVAMALPAAREEVFEDPAALEEPEKLLASELEPPVVVAAEVPRAIEVPIVAPEVWTVKPQAPAAVVRQKSAVLVEMGKRVSAWGESVAANRRLLKKAATVAAMGAVAVLSVVVLGSAVHRFAPVTPGTSASESLVLPATADASSTTVETPRSKIRLSDPAKVAAKAKARRVHNPEEDIVAKDYVIRFNKRPTAVRAKKTSGVKHYSDLR
jgi:hypothetical protein